MDIHITTGHVPHLKLSVECFAIYLQLKVVETIIGIVCFPPGQGLCSVWEAVTPCTTRSRLQLLHTLQTHSAVRSLQSTAQTQTGNNEYYFLLHEASSLQHPQNKNMYISKQITWPVGSWVYVKWLCLMLGASVWKECNEKGKAE